MEKLLDVFRLIQWNSFYPVQVQRLTAARWAFKNRHDRDNVVLRNFVNLADGRVLFSDESAKSYFTMPPRQNLEVGRLITPGETVFLTIGEAEEGSLKAGAEPLFLRVEWLGFLFIRTFDLFVYPGRPE